MSGEWLEAFYAWLEGITKTQDVNTLRGILENDFWKLLGQTLYMTFVPTLIAFLIGLPLGVFLVTGEEKGIRPMPKALMKTVNLVINLFRSVPFLILLVILLPFSRALIHTSVGAKAIVPALSIAAIPFVARLVETSIREVDPGVVEAAQSMGASVTQIIWKVLVPEAVPSLISNFTVALITIFGYGAMSGAVGGGGFGNTAITNGYQRNNPVTMWFAVILLILLVQLFQTVGNRLARRADKRIR